MTIADNFIVILLYIFYKLKKYNNNIIIMITIVNEAKYYLIWVRNVSIFCTVSSICSAKIKS